MKKVILLYVFVIVATVLLPITIHAGVGVGVGLGKIRVEQPLKPGMVYKVVELPVLNTGSETGLYELSITFHREQVEFRPSREWFVFTPQRFSLEPGGVQLVEIIITLPLRGVKPGDYFGYLEARPIIEDVAGVSSIGVAAATKLWFTAAPANLWQAVYYRASYKIGVLWALCTPWIWFVIILAVGAIIVSVLKRFFNFQIKRK